MRICFLWYWDRAQEIFPNWRDGLRGALEELSKEHQVDILLGEVTPPDDCDFLLFWGDSNCPFFSLIESYKCKKGIILTTDPHNVENLKKLDVIFCESQPIFEAVTNLGLNAVRAFGTDTDFYKPLEGEALFELKDIEYFYPATFSPWKKQSLIAHLGNKLTCIGTVQPDGEEELKACEDSGVNVEVGYFSPEKIREYYRRAKYVPIPAIHGSERTCLEAMAMNIIPTVNFHNRRTLSYVLEYVQSGILTPREFVEKNYSHKTYAKALLGGMQ